MALIAHRSDLGSIGALWNKPNVYSGFLGTELSLVFHGTLLVVMPNGYGVDVIGEPGAGGHVSFHTHRAGGRPPEWLKISRAVLIVLDPSGTRMPEQYTPGLYPDARIASTQAKR